MVVSVPSNPAVKIWMPAVWEERLMVGRVVSIDISLKLIGSILAVAALNDGRFSIACRGYVDTAFYCVISACTVKRHFEIIT